MAKRYKINIKILLLVIVSFFLIIFTVEGMIKTLHPLKYKEYVFKYSTENKLDPYLVFSVIKAESSFNPDATSHRNARGLMQITDDTAKWVAQKMGLKDFEVEQLYDPEINIRMGCWYLNNLRQEFGDNKDLILAAYNGGRGHVNKWLKNKELSSTGESLDKIPFEETDRYVKKVNNYYIIYKKLYDN